MGNTEQGILSQPVGCIHMLFLHVLSSLRT